SSCPQIKVLFLRHPCFFFFLLISITAKVEDAVDDDAMQFIPFGHIEFQRILPHPVNADENIARDNIILLTAIKRNDIRIGIMLEVLLIDFQEISVATEDDTDFANLEVLGPNRRFYPALQR